VLLRGGTTLTIAGELLDVIEEPQLMLTVVHTHKEAGTIQRDSTDYSSVSNRLISYAHSRNLIDTMEAYSGID